MKIRKHSRQRDAILKNLSSRLDHPTADMIYRDLREELHQIMTELPARFSLQRESSVLRTVMEESLSALTAS